MRFVDSNVFVHALLRPRRRLETHEDEIKEGAKNILTRIEEGGEAMTTVIHVSEVANILEARMPREGSWRILSALASMRGLSLAGVTGDAYSAAIQTSNVLGVGVNDALAYTSMTRSGVREIYSFDKHFDQLPEIRRVTE
ncbi:MAG: type II toxin-antitoxin system VapC family toxin [Candidatus Bathyarchaeota archaeon]